MATQHAHPITQIDRPDIRGKIFVGQLMNADTGEHEQVLFRLSMDENPFHGTFRGGPVGFGTFFAQWRGEHLVVDWRSAIEGEFVSGRTYCSVERVCGDRVAIHERWMEHEEGTRPGFLTLEEPMCDGQS